MRLPKFNRRQEGWYIFDWIECQPGMYRNVHFGKSSRANCGGPVVDEPVAQDMPVHAASFVERPG